MGKLKVLAGPTVSEATAASTDTDRASDLQVIHDGELTYTVVKANNGSGVTYQEAVGAPVESNSPLGYHVGWVTVIFLNVNHMIGTGIFSTPGTILAATGSIGLALLYWTIGILLAVTGFSVYLELASYFPNRSGGEVVYLEQAYPRPRHFFPIAFAFYSVVLSFSSSNAIVLSNYLFALAHKTPTDWESKGVAVAAYTAAVICVIAHNKYSLWATNIIGIVKVITLIFISITGFVVLGGHVARIPDPGLNFRNSFEGTTNNGNDLSVALVNVLFAYNGYANAFGLANEIKNPIPTLKRNGAISITIVALLYILCNIAYFAAVPKETFAQSKAIAASVFFGAVFGQGRAQDALNALVLISAFGNLLAVLIGQSRLIREIGRQGVLPFTEFWVSTKPFGTPIGPYLLKYVVTVIFIIAPPAGDAFQFIVSLKTYPDGVFFTAMAIGVYLIRYRQKRLNREKPAFKAWDACVIFFLLVQIYTLATPWIPPKGGPYAGAVSFWYATYAAVGIGIIVGCGIYYICWMQLIPKWKGYRLRPEILNVDDQGANTHRLVKVPVDELEKWDSEHDEAGRLRRTHRVEQPVAETSSVEKEL
ncbi:high-affinity methionine permease [Xylaria bambusicola]|uniref:high-affinity methionine permease n=1 Tax=Xylaria bambusicola TaxID=326684 RepID=UPI00200727FE|nr:high-affinity methionine permease [Xylaria bambusicola]KAI0514855.1 high-affinity methionine permease [Xylaria bambusicola]